MIAVNSRVRHPQASRPCGLLSGSFIKKCKSKQIVKKSCKPYCTSSQPVVVSTACEWLDHFTGKVLRFFAETDVPMQHATKVTLDRCLAAAVCTLCRSFVFASL